MRVLSSTLVEREEACQEDAHSDALERNVDARQLCCVGSRAAVVPVVGRRRSVSSTSIPPRPAACVALAARCQLFEQNVIGTVIDRRWAPSV